MLTDYFYKLPKLAALHSLRKASWVVSSALVCFTGNGPVLICSSETDGRASECGLFTPLYGIQRKWGNGNNLHLTNLDTVRLFYLWLSLTRAVNFFENCLVRGTITLYIDIYFFFYIYKYFAVFFFASINVYCFKVTSKKKKVMFSLMCEILHAGSRDVSHLCVRFYMLGVRKSVQAWDSCSMHESWQPWLYHHKASWTVCLRKNGHQNICTLSKCI